MCNYKRKQTGHPKEYSEAMGMGFLKSVNSSEIGAYQQMACELILALKYFKYFISE